MIISPFLDDRKRRTLSNIEPRGAELGHRQQGNRAQRFLGVHDLGR